MFKYSCVWFFAVKRGFTRELCIKFNDETYEVVKELADELFEGNMSQAIRYIIKQYKEYIKDGGGAK
jgi:sulfur relay (sulfurtransferase) DsrC/TusE family protein